MATVIVKEDGVMSEIVITKSISIVDGHLQLDERSFEITDRFCMEAEDISNDSD